MVEEYGNQRAEEFGLMHFIVRLIAGIVVLGITALFTPGFAITGVWALILGAVVLAVLDYALAKMFGVNATPFGKGILGFVLAAIIIYSTQFFVAGFEVTVLGAIIGALVYGIVDMLVPGRRTM